MLKDFFDLGLIRPVYTSRPLTAKPLPHPRARL